MIDVTRSRSTSCFELMTIVKDSAAPPSYAEVVHGDRQPGML